MELAIATSIPAACWAREDDQIIVTAMHVLHKHAEEVKKKHG